MYAGDTLAKYSCTCQIVPEVMYGEGGSLRCYTTWLNNIGSRVGDSVMRKPRGVQSIKGTKLTKAQTEFKSGTSGTGRVI